MPGRITLAATVAAAPDLLFAGVFLATWIVPTALGAQMVGYLMLTMLLEFVIMHSSGIMGTTAYGPLPGGRKTLAVVGLGLFYSLFVLGFCLAFGTWWPFVAFWTLTGNRLLGALIGQAPEGEEKRFVQQGWAVAALAYLVLAFFTTLVPMPALGITPEVVAGQHLPGSGLWVDQPQRVIAFGFLYFAAVGVSELHGHAWLQRATETGTLRA